MIKLPEGAGADKPNIGERSQFLHDLGTLVALWNYLELWIEVKIGLLTGMSPRTNAIVNGGLQFKAKVSILYALLREAGELDAIQKTKAAVTYAKRNALMHSIIAGEHDYSSFGFLYRSLDDRYRTKTHRFSAEDFHKHVWQFRELANDALDAFSGLQDVDLDAYGKAAGFDDIGQ